MGPRKAAERRSSYRVRESLFQARNVYSQIEGYGTGVSVNLLTFALVEKTGAYEHSEDV